MIQIPGLDLEAFLKFTTNPENTSAIIKVQEALVESPTRDQAAESINSVIIKNRKFMEMFERKYFGPLPKSEEFLAMPEDSLGFAVGQHLKKHNISIDFEGLNTEIFVKYFDVPTKYMGARALKHHDIYHAVLNLDISPFDEYYLAAFQLGQFQSPYHMALLSSAV